MSNARNERTWKSRLARSNRQRGRKLSRQTVSKASHRFLPDAQPLEDRRLLTLTLNVNGTAAADTILFDYVSSLNQIQYSVNGTISVLSVQPELSSIVINGFGGQDTIRVLREPGIAMTIDGGADNDSIIIGQDAGRFASLRTDEIEIRGGGGDQDSILVIDNASPDDSRPYFISSDFVARQFLTTFSAYDGVSLDSVERINVASNSLGTEIHVNFLDAGHTVSITDAGGADTLIFGAIDRYSFDDINENSLDSIQGTIEYESLGTGGGSAIFHDEGSLFDGDYQISSTSTQTVLARGGAVWKLKDTQDFSLFSGEGAARFKVESTQAGTSWHIDAGGGNDIFRVTPGRRYSSILVEGGRLNAIRGPLTFVGGTGTDEASFDDQFSSTALNYELKDARIAWSGESFGAADAEVTLVGVEDRTIVTGLGADMLIAGTRNLGNLFTEHGSDVDIVNAGGEDTVSIYDKAALQGGGYFLDENTSGGVSEYTFQKTFVLPLDPFPFVLFSGRIAMRGDFEIRVLGVDDAEYHVDIETARGIYLESKAYSSSTFYVDAAGLATGSFVINGGEDIDDLDDNPWSQSLSRVVVTGADSDTAAYRPGRVRSDGILTVNQDHSIFIGNVAALFVEGFGELGFTTPRGKDVVEVRPVALSVADADDPPWAVVAGTSGTIESLTRFWPLEPVMLGMHYRDIGTLIIDTATNDGRDGVSILSQPDQVDDLVTLRPRALHSRYAETVRFVMGNGTDVLRDETLLDPLPEEFQARLETDFHTPVTHDVAGTAAEIRIGSLRALGPDGEMLHEVHATGPARYVLPDPQELVTFEQSNVRVELDAGSEGRQLVRSSHSLATWEFANTPDGQTRLTTQADSTVAIIAILNIAPVLRGGSGHDVLTVIGSALGENGVSIEGLDASDTLRLTMPSVPGNGNFFGVDFSDPEQASFAMIGDPRLPGTDPRLAYDLGMLRSITRGEVLRTPTGELPNFEMIGNPAALSNVALVTAPESSTTLPNVGNVGLNSIELLVVIGPELFVLPGDDGPSVNDRGNLRVTSDSSLGEVIPDTVSRPGDLGRVEVNVRPVITTRTNITPYAVELLVYEGPGDLMSFQHFVRRGFDPVAARFATIERVIAGDVTVQRSLGDDPLNTTLEASNFTSIIDDGDYTQDFDLKFIHTGSTSTFDIQGRFQGRVSLSVEGAVSNNRIAISACDSEFLGGFAVDIDSPASGTTTAVIGETGVYYGPGSYRDVRMTSAGAETLLFQGDSDVRTAPGVIRNTDIDLAGASATILSGAGSGMSPVELYGIIASLRELEMPIDARYQSVFELLPDRFGMVGQPPAQGVDAFRSIDISGTGDIAGAGYDAQSLTTVTAGHTGAFDMTAGTGVALVIPGLDEIELPPGSVHLSTVTHTGDSGPGSLRAALVSASTAPVGSTALIRFAIPASDPNFRDVDAHLPGGDAAPDAFVISPLSALPVIVRGNVVINGASQTAFSGDSNAFGPEIVLAGQLAGPTANGLEIRSNENQVHSLNVQGFGRSGVFLAGDGNSVTGSYLGTDATGAPAPGTANAGSGVRISAGSGNMIGGNSPGEGNVIAGNRGDGVLITGGTGHRVEANVISSNQASGVLVFGTATSGNLVGGNLIGTDSTGQIDRGNAIMGVWIINSPGNAVRENLISGNDVNGLVIAGATASGNLAEGNYIGTDVSGTYAIGNVLGIHLADAPNNVVRGNLLSGNLVGLDISGTPATGNIATGNFIGTTASGTAALPNRADGIFIDDAPGNRIGGSGPGEGNVIGANGFRGIYIDGTDSTDNVVTGNRIGLGADGVTPLGNVMAGIEIAAGASRNRVGTNGDGIGDALEGNRIAHNGGAGVSVVGDTSRGNTIRGNAISANGGLGIDLSTAGVNSNDTLDADTGANDLQNHPVLENARNNGSNVQINGTLRSTPNSRFHVDFYANESPDASGYGEGRRWIGSIVVQTDANGFASYQFTGSPDLAIRDEWVSASATAQATGSTSEFSNARQVLGRQTQPPGRGRGESAEASTSGLVVLNQAAVDALLPNLDSESSRFRLVARSRRGRGMRV